QGHDQREAGLHRSRGRHCRAGRRAAGGRMNALPLAFGAPLLTAAIRSVPEDFQVDELPAFEATGEGEHLLLEIRKRGANTVAIAKRLAQWAGVPEMGVSYAGQKDRHAVTTQRFSVHLPKRIAPDMAMLESEEMQ